MLRYRIQKRIDRKRLTCRGPARLGGPGSRKGRERPRNSGRFAAQIASAADSAARVTPALPWTNTNRVATRFDALEATKPAIDVGLYHLMGGAIEDEWVRQPDKPWVLVGTQDQLLSRVLNRGYAMSRFEWPVHFGLLNNDCRWIIDEVQLTGPGLWTKSQLDWMRRKRFRRRG